jgi:hypothetical protein
MTTTSQALSDYDLWTDKAIRLEQEAKLYRKRAQAALDSAQGNPGKTALEYQTRKEIAA